MNYKKILGFYDETDDLEQERNRLQLYINLKLASSGQPTCQNDCNHDFMSIAHDLLLSYKEKSRLLADYLCPADQRIQQFIDNYFSDCKLPHPIRLPRTTMVLDRHGVARELSLPPSKSEYSNSHVTSYRIQQGVLHNPISDRRTTKGSFHVAEGGLPISGDKISVPKKTFCHLLYAALNPPEDLLTLPFTATQEDKAKLFVSLLLRPTVCPSVQGWEEEKSMEIRFFAPGSLVSNLDFVESIFGNAGNPYLPVNDAALDIEHWTGHTGCVILAPHLLKLTKKEVGLPHISEATEHQKKQGMCWEQEDEKYNDGQAFKITARNEDGLIVTIITDNYFGYCKKEVKTQISFSTNLFGLAEEEHAGGALTFVRHNHGEEFGKDSKTRNAEYTFEDVIKNYGDLIKLQPEGYAISKEYPQLLFVPEKNLQMDINKMTVSWQNKEGKASSIKLQPDKVYMHPSGYRVNMQKHPNAPSWRLIGTEAEGTFCHKPSTVSGGGKSEISKSIEDSMIYGPLFIAELEKDLDQVQNIFDYDFSGRFLPEQQPSPADTRSFLDSERSLGSVIKLLIPSPLTFTKEYNDWISTIPHQIKALAFAIKRFYNKEWGTTGWRKHFSVDWINDNPGNELKYDGRNIVMSYIRVGLEDNGSWRIYKARQDYIAAEKVQMEDDISVSIVVPKKRLSNSPAKSPYDSVKLVKNCEYRLFQRPDEAVHKGFDKQTEWDMAQPGNFIANFEPLSSANAKELSEDISSFYKYTDPMKNLISKASEDSSKYVVSSAHPRMVDGSPSKNPRYLQTRPDITNSFKTYIAKLGARFQRRAKAEEDIFFPVDSVLTGRRNNPPEPGIRPLAVYNPIHYQELPELFMDFICSLTGKSPSTTGAGSEGALTKSPFNALRTTADLNNTLVSFIITGYGGFSSAAGWVGPNIRVDHDISLLIPEIWARIPTKYQQPALLIKEGHLEKLEDFEHKGEKVLASRLGYRITQHFVRSFFGRIFDTPTTVFDEKILKPEKQGIDCYVDGINNIIEAQQTVAQQYIDDNSIEEACPPIKALLTIMATGEYEGKDAHHPDIRNLFEYDTVINSDWYKERLQTKQDRDIKLWTRHINYLENIISQENYADEVAELKLNERLEQAKNKLIHVKSDQYLESLKGTIGADPMKASAN
ncbi:MAG: hypothetical protein HN826_05205 [Methylococcales bacterium]|jgi:hypothetical protein|nr:hypothetical protein [Methylococcales bacterium]